MSAVAAPTTGLPCPSSKVLARHQARLALVYVRQSTVQQLTRNPESTRLQYVLRDRALALGWEPDRIVVIDDDLGRSGCSTAGRPGFRRLVAEVGLDHVGVILGVEMSRFARSCRDWHQLIEICALFGTLIADLDGIYDPSNHNDRLLLGLKGTIPEAELHLLKRRMLDGRAAKALRGELGSGCHRLCPAPLGGLVARHQVGQGPQGRHRRRIGRLDQPDVPSPSGADGGPPPPGHPSWGGAPPAPAGQGGS